MVVAADSKFRTPPLRILPGNPSLGLARITNAPSCPPPDTAMSAPASPDTATSAPATGKPPFLSPPADGSGGGVSLGRELSHPPSDGISNLRFSRHNNSLLVSSWDKTVRLYDAEANSLVGTFTYARRPVLDCCFHDETSAFSAGSDGTVRSLSFKSGTHYLLGQHESPIRCVEYSYSSGQVITGSWDKTIKCWDPRGVNGPEHTLVGTHIQPERVYSLSLLGYMLVVATAGRHVNIYDLRNMSEPLQQRESKLKYQTRCVECYPDGTGRVALEFFDQSVSLSKGYAFKCHRLSEDGRCTIYPVNAIAFHPIYGTFATGGCDGYVNVWDGDNQKRLFQYPRYPSSIAALSFSKDGSLLAVASSYTYERGNIPHEPDAIFIRDVNEVEVTCTATVASPSV